MPSHTRFLDSRDRLPLSQLGRYHGGGQCYDHRLDSPPRGSRAHGGGGYEPPKLSAEEVRHRALLKRMGFQKEQKARAAQTPPKGLEEVRLDKDVISPATAKLRFTLSADAGSTLKMAVYDNQGNRLASRSTHFNRTGGEQTFEIQVNTANGVKPHVLNLDIRTGTRITGHRQVGIGAL